MKKDKGILTKWRLSYLQKKPNKSAMQNCSPKKSLLKNRSAKNSLRQNSVKEKFWLPNNKLLMRKKIELHRSANRNMNARNRLMRKDVSLRRKSA